MKKVYAGGPLLGRKGQSSSKTSQLEQTTLCSHDTLEPLITAPISSSREQFVILPSTYFITVLSYNTGRRVVCLIPKLEHDEDEVSIESACLAKFTRRLTMDRNILTQSPHSENDDDNDASSQEMEEEKQNLRDDDDVDDHVLLVGCGNGLICEFSLNVLVDSMHKYKKPNFDCGPYTLLGPIVGPRRRFSVAYKQPILHLTAPRLVELDGGGALVYATTEVDRSTADESSTIVKQSLVRLVIPSPQNTPDGLETIKLAQDEGDASNRQVDEFKCRVGRDSMGRYQDTRPFRLISISKGVPKLFSENYDAVSQHDVFVVLARSNAIAVYYERVGHNTTAESLKAVTFPIHPPRILTALSVAPNGRDISCGYQEGDIRIMSNVLPQVVEYLEAKTRHAKQPESTAKPVHPSKTVLVRRIHWHAHPVATLAYHGVSAAVEPMLYSGGEESVLVTWQLARGTYRPADVLPRLAKGGIVHICCADGEQEGGAGGILVYSEDNSLQLFESHNRSLLWKVQGLANLSSEASRHYMQSSLPLTRMRVGTASSSRSLILTGLLGAPGCVHWFNVDEQKVTRQLEIAPYNRISRVERTDMELPVPSITHCEFSDNDQELMTVDTVATENAFVGATEHVQRGQAVGVITTLQFWTRSPLAGRKQTEYVSPYVRTASMTHPHGEENRVSAIAISRDGQYACSVSNEESAFRLWHRVASVVEDENKKSRRTPVWTCQYKVTTPSGYSNTGTGVDAVAFSSDGTTLSVCYGNMITLWDHKQATLLKSLRHLDDDIAPVVSLQFVKTHFLHDLLLSQSRSGVTLQSPYGNGGQASWSCALPPSYKEASVSDIELIAESNLIALSIVYHQERQSRVVLLDAVTGSPYMEDDKPVMWDIEGLVRALGAHRKLRQKSKWISLGTQRGEAEELKSNPASLFVMIETGDVLILQTGSEPHQLGVSHPSTGIPPSNIPKLYIPNTNRDRKRQLESMVPIADVKPAKKSALGGFGTFLSEDGSDSAPLLSSDLPVLSGAFTTAFVGRALKKRTAPGTTNSML